MPDDTPAEVNTSPSRTKIASGSTLTSGKMRANRPVCRQCVVARLPLSRPACARMNEPVQTDAKRRVRPGTVLSASMSGIDRPPDQRVTARDHDGVDGFEGREGTRHSESGADRRGHIASVYRCDFERIACAEPIGFGEHLGGTRNVQQFHAVEDDDHHHTSC